MARKHLIALAAAAAMIAGQALAADAAAQLAALKGEVLVSRDGKLLKAAPGALRNGDRIVSRGDGEARLAYADGCAVTLKPNAMVTVSAASPCAGGAGLVSAGAATAQATQQQGLSALQWAGVGLTVVVLGVGLAAAADDLSISN